MGARNRKAAVWPSYIAAHSQDSTAIPRPAHALDAVLVADVVACPLWRIEYAFRSGTVDETSDNILRVHRRDKLTHSVHVPILQNAVRALLALNTN